MNLTLSQLTLAHTTYWLGTTTQGLAFVGRANGPANEWQTFYPQATTFLDAGGNQAAAQALTAYLQGRTQQINVPLDLSHGTTFQQLVWRGLQAIPYGTTTTYTDLAQQIDRPTAVRAVASAVGRNPLLIVVPCHRVLRKDGQLGGYRGGLTMKKALLTLEGCTFPL
ncbi:methylated-DNA--[protein]-cysteine S-methyltransferase [Lactiplantibacillus fabifermentans]|uniref:methylated-DNA--[protein]-cysteine S-methyltransferase n=2 Tax=Lactiplantibacillus fabifermentans TaxID=483011 RepID=A0A0R2NSH0_9LACO|nr:methylated-DNA--[protein]-cysteine S-methyltransferase [Lactiplantibacillus fabifermentans]ETY73359.1 methylated-DNA--protein-cysteine methyltransferase [Lactiplantibacillus fabifermentans T30PCM01]KRO28623.1 methylated-dna--[protein]-cysteine s-methyltransferase [Lactiplantibacillus fabifermentans DSM 21115]